jgi:hypothetical protein
VEEVQQYVLMRQWDEMDDDELQREMARLMAHKSQLEFEVHDLRVSHERQAGETGPDNVQENDATFIFPNGPPCVDGSVGASVAPGDERPHLEGPSLFTCLEDLVAEYYPRAQESPHHN